ncbi:MAG TPA: AraC family transcriptional regulator [Pseudobdellovibrionaceae bacterium]|nr:AraC family transcriptional regulator [Pseudobdellovibrionaceae bacterium]
MTIQILGEHQIARTHSTKNYQFHRVTTLGDVEISLEFPNPTLLFAVCHSVFLMSSEKLERIDIYRVLIIPPRHPVLLKNITHSSEFCLLSVYDPLIEKTIKNFNLEKKELHHFIEHLQLLPRNNWLNETISRFSFEFDHYINPIPNAATDFLDAEILKESYYMNRPKEIISYNDRINLDPHLFSKQSNLLKKTIAYIDSNLAQPITVDQIAEVVGSSSSTLQKSFLDSLKMPLGQFITHTRLDRALMLLSSPHSSVGEVAYLVGFRSQSSFVKAFKKKFNKLPSDIQN